jgi:hypothetical protein
MFLSRSDEEINVNRKLAKELVDKWVSRRKLVFGIILCALLLPKIADSLRHHFTIILCFCHLFCDFRADLYLIRVLGLKTCEIMRMIGFLTGGHQLKSMLLHLSFNFLVHAILDLLIAF